MGFRIDAQAGRGSYFSTPSLRNTLSVPLSSREELWHILGCGQAIRVSHGPSRKQYNSDSRGFTEGTAFRGVGLAKGTEQVVMHLEAAAGSHYHPEC